MAEILPMDFLYCAGDVRYYFKRHVEVCSMQSSLCFVGSKDPGELFGSARHGSLWHFLWRWVSVPSPILLRREE